MRLLIPLLLVGCSQATLSASPPLGVNAPYVAATRQGSGASHGSALHRGPITHISPITHIVVIIQENRSVDNLFQFLPGANTQSWGINPRGKVVQLHAEPLTGSAKPGHTHPDFLRDYDSGGMNGWYPSVFAYVPQSEVAPYYQMAEAYTFGDEMFQSNQGPSFPAHQYIVSGTSTISDGSGLRASENPRTPDGSPTGGCDSPPGSLVTLIDAYGNETQSTYPCFDRISIMTRLDTAGLSWRYYQASQGAGFWKAADALEPIWSSKYYADDVISPSSEFLTDVEHKGLAAVTWITPTAAASDHAGLTDGSGPSWVASVVNAIGESQYWDSTAIFIIWDDWGGWFDHASPTIYNSYELGFRVPFVLVSPYAKLSYISHTPHEFGSILKYIEETFDLPSLQTTDVRADDLSDCFNYLQSPTPFEPIGSPHKARYFLTRPLDTRPIDDDKAGDGGSD